jgi:hypothetical protein
MATYAELLNLANTNDALKQKIKMACIVACDVIRAESDATPQHAARLIWARATLSNPDTAAAQMVLAVLAQNRELTVAQITGAADADVQTAVNAAVNLLAA